MKTKKKVTAFDVGLTIFVILIFLIAVYPLYFVVIASFSEPHLVSTGEVFLIPKEITLEGYQKVLRDEEIWTGYRNTIFYTVFGTALNLAITLPAAYALSRKQLAGRKLFMLLILFTMFFSGGMIPTYILVKGLHLTDTVWALILPCAASAYNIVVARTYFENSIPGELEEAARIDGCSDFKAFFRIILPLSAPIVAVMTLFYGISHWNSYFDGMIYLSDRNLFPLQVILREILSVAQTSASQTMSAEDAVTMAEQARIADLVKYVIMIVATAPVMFIYPFVQKYFVKGIMIGSIKG